MPELFGKISEIDATIGLDMKEKENANEKETEICAVDKSFH